MIGKKTKKDNLILIGCISFSLVLHFCLLFILQEKGGLFQTKKIVSIEDTPVREDFLYSVFSEIPLENVSQEFLASEEKKLDCKIPLQLEEKDYQTKVKEKNDDKWEEFSIECSLAQEKKKIKSIDLNIVEQLTKLADTTSKIEYKNDPDLVNYTSNKEAEKDQLAPQLSEKLKSLNKDSSYLQNLSKPIFSSLEKTNFINQPFYSNSQMAPKVAWHLLPTFSELNTSSCAEDFDMELSFLPKTDEEGYIFALTLIPKPYVDFPRIKQNVYFLLNRSNGVGAKRFQASQSAIYRSLSYLREEDTFNIIAYDNNVNILSPYNLNPKKDSLITAKNFLAKISLGNIFTSSNLFTPLKSIMSMPREKEEIDVVILLTNGEGISKAFNSKYVLDSWTVQNKGNCSLFSILMDTDNKLSLSELFTIFNKGKLITSSTKRGIKRKLLQLMRSLDHPIAKNVSFTPVGISPGADIRIFSHLRAPNLYRSEPYVIVGSVNKLDDFFLFIQGKQNGRWLNIKKKISFINAKSGDNSLRKQWALNQAYDLYQKFLKDSQPSHLEKIKVLLSPYDIDLALE